LESRARRPSILLVDDDPFLACARKLALEKSFRDVERVADATEAFIRLNEPGFSKGLGLVVVGLQQPGMSGPEFVKELCSRLNGVVPVLAIGRAGEVAADYCRGQVCFLPRPASIEDMVVAASGMLALPLARIA